MDGINHLLNSRVETLTLQYTSVSPVSLSNDRSYGRTGDNGRTHTFKGYVDVCLTLVIL